MKCRIKNIFSFPTKNDGRLERKGTIEIDGKEIPVVFSAGEKYARILNSIEVQKQYRLISDKSLVKVQTEGEETFYLIQ